MYRLLASNGQYIVHNRAGQGGAIHVNAVSFESFYDEDPGTLSRGDT